MKWQPLAALVVCAALSTCLATDELIAESFQGLGDLPGGEIGSWAQGISADGLVVVGQSESLSASGHEAFRWTQAGGMVGLGDLPGGVFDSTARAVSADGAVVVGLSTSGSGTEAFRWTESGGMVGLGALSGDDFESVATGVSDDGSVVVGCPSGKRV